MRRLILLLLLVLGTLLVSLQFGQISKFVVAIENGQPLWILVAVVAQLVWQMLQVGEFRATHELAGSSQAWRAILPVSVANNFIVVAAPSGSVSTFALFIADAKRRGLGASPVVLGVVLFAVVEYWAICMFVGADLVELLGQRLFGMVLVPGLIIVGVASLFTGMVWVGLHSPVRLIHWVTKLIKPFNRVSRRLGRPDLLSDANLNAMADALVNDFGALRRKPKVAWTKPFVTAVMAKIWLLVLFSIVGLAFDQPLAWVNVLTAVTVGLAFTVVSPTPLGIGVADGAIIIALISMGVSNERAILISLAYRGFTLWLPMVYGFLVLEFTGMRSAWSGK